MANSNRSKDFLAITVGIVIAVAIVEIFGRVAPLNTGFRAGMRYLQYHPAMGYELDPSVGSIPYESACISIDKVSIGTDGNRVVPFAPAAPRYDIAVLGDSFMMAREMSDGEHFATLLARELGDARVANFGVAGYGTIQQYLTYREKVSATKPDITVLAFFDANDVVENSPALTTADRLQRLRPFFDPETRDLRLSTRADWDALQNPPKLQLLHATLKNYSFTYHAVITYIAKPLSDLLRGSPTRAAAPAAPAGAQPADIAATQPATAGSDRWWQRDPLYQNIAVYQAPPDDIWEQAWQDTELALTTLNAAIRADGGRLVVMTIPSTGVMWKLITLEKYAKDFGTPEPPGFDTGYPARRLQSLATQQGFDVVDLTPLFEDYMARHPMERRSPFYYTCDGHWNPLAHYLAAQGMSDFLAGRGYIDATRDAGRPWLDRSPETLLGADAARQLYEWGGTYYGYSALDSAGR